MDALYIAFDVYPRPKGASSHIESMLGALAGEFDAVHAVCLGDRDMPAIARDGNVVIHRLLAGAQLAFLDRVTAFAQFVARRAMDVRSRLGLVVFRDPWGGAAVTRALPEIPAIFEVNALPSWELAYSRPGILQSATFAAKLGDLERFCLSRAARVLCVSGVTRRALVQEGVARDKSVVIPNSALLSATASEPVSPPVIGYIGGLQPWQGVEALIDAFAMIAPGYAHVRLMIVHSGNRETRVLERQILDRGLSARVVLWDPLPAAELAALMSQMVCTVAPLADTPRNTHQGCCPVKIVESMAAGVPVVATDLEVCRELIEHGVDGWLVKRGDNRALAQGLERMLQDRSLRKRLADGAKRKALERFSRPVTHSALRRVFRDVAGWGKGGGKWRVS